MIFEIFKNEKGHYQLIMWTEEDLSQMFDEMTSYWSNDEFWDQVMVGYTDLSGEDLQNYLANITNNQETCEFIA